MLVIITISPFKSGSFTFKPTLAKNTGDNNYMMCFKSLYYIYSSLFDESTRHYICPCYIGNTKNSSALNDTINILRKIL